MFTARQHRQKQVEERGGWHPASGAVHKDEAAASKTHSGHGGRCRSKRAVMLHFAVRRFLIQDLPEGIGGTIPDRKDLSTIAAKLSPQKVRPLHDALLERLALRKVPGQNDRKTQRWTLREPARIFHDDDPCYRCALRRQRIGGSQTARSEQSLKLPTRKAPARNGKQCGPSRLQRLEHPAKVAVPLWHVLWPHEERVDRNGQGIVDRQKQDMTRRQRNLIEHRWACRHGICPGREHRRGNARWKDRMRRHRRESVGQRDPVKASRGPASTCVSAARWEGWHVHSRRLRLLLLPLTACLALCSPGASGHALYGPVPAAAYLTGRFQPESHPGFVRVDRLGIKSARVFYIRKDAGEALRRMHRAFQQAHPRVRFEIVSATRNFDSQRSIWDGKWSGSIKVNGKSLARTVPDPLARGRLILRYSSMPGTSRHHWGTDVDITSLENAYFEKGPGRLLFDWLEQNAAQYGFCRPYTAGRATGYQEERWHWSYRPVSARLLAEWSRLFGRDPAVSLRFARFLGSDAVRQLAPVYAQSVSEACR